MLKLVFQYKQTGHIRRKVSLAKDFSQESLGVIIEIVREEKSSSWSHRKGTDNQYHDRDVVELDTIHLEICVSSEASRSVFS